MSYQQFTLKQQFQLEVWLRITRVQKDIAQWMDTSESTISRELSRNGGSENYEARHARSLTMKRRKFGKSKSKRLLTDRSVYSYVEEKLKIYWSPEQISGRLRKDSGIIICHETIYQFIYDDKPEWKQYLRQKKGKYRRRHGTKEREKAREEAKKQRIDTRPDIVSTRSRIGDWEGDTIVGGERTQHILTHVDRKSGLLLADKLKNGTAELTRIKTIARFKTIPKNKKYTSTYDNGSTFADYETTAKKTGLDIYFANPYHSWERGTNENTNGLLRQFFPKKSLFATLTQKIIDDVVGLINNRPRKRLGYLTPYEVFMAED